MQRVADHPSLLGVLGILFITGCGGAAPQPAASTTPHVGGFDRAPGPQAPPPRPLVALPGPHVEKVRDMLQCANFKEEAGMRAFFDLGDRLFPAFEAILADLKSDPWHVQRAMFVISEMKTDRRRFIPLTIRRLVESDPEDRFVSGVRYGAVRLLAEIGSEHDTAAVIPLLSDKDSSIRYAAPITLAKIGGKRDLETMDAWLKNGKNPRPKDTDYPLHVKKYRDELEKRLKDNPIPKDIIN